MFVLFYFIQNFFNYLLAAFNETCEFYVDIGRTIAKTSDCKFNFYEFIQCLNDLLDEMYGHGKEPDVVVVEKPLVLYENKYVDKYNNLQPKVLELQPKVLELQPKVLELQPKVLELQPKVLQKGCFIIEMTPIGNVIMQYDMDKEAFVYYSDNMIPFRYLETVARKYVCTYNCKELYVERHEVVHKDEEEKKPVKTKDLIQLKRNATKPVVSKVEVKMNRYSNLGRFSNFNMLQKVERHVTDKKRLLRFSDFKRQSVVS
jgi:hypothetical protein